MLNQNDKSSEDLKTEIEELNSRIKYLEDFLTSYRIEMEDEAQKNQKEMIATKNYLAHLLSNMSYEIRIPMNGIIGMVDILRQTQISPEQKEFIDILDYSKIETGQIKLNYTIFDINTIIDSVVLQLSPIAKAKGLILNFLQKPSSSYSIVCDEERVKQLLINLINNCFKNTLHGSVSIKSEFQQIKDNQVNLFVKIVDSGNGLPQELQKVIFKDKAIFTQIGEEFMGPGLGPSIAYDLVKLLKGEIGFENDSDKSGTTYWFKIPVSIVATPKIVENQIVVPTVSNKSLYVLLVEDNFLNQKVVIATLLKAGHKVDLAENGKIGIEMFQSNDYDLILMDIQMPVMDGIEATINIRLIEKEDNRPAIKIIAVTAFAMDKDKEQCLNAGMDLFLPKPFKPNELLDIINKLEL
jgi:CheY-like chemotaxis protein/nitrogen-specific signal transduction histidine kinase